MIPSVMAKLTVETSLIPEEKILKKFFVCDNFLIMKLSQLIIQPILLIIQPSQLIFNKNHYPSSPVFLRYRTLSPKINLSPECGLSLKRDNSYNLCLRFLEEHTYKRSSV